jgi:hypothetical protein
MDPNANLAELRSATFNLRHAAEQELAWDAAEVLRVCELIGALDEWLSRDGFPPTEWKRTIDPQDEQRGELDLRAAFRAGHVRGLYDSVREGLETWNADVPLDEDRYVATALELGPVAEQGLAPDDGPQPGHEAPRGVHLAVSYHGEQTRYFPVGEDGWRFDTSTRELVIGRGVPRTHVPLDTVAHYDIEDC